MSFFDSSAFVGLSTLVVGAAAYGVYSKQKSDAKRDAANIVLLEIENAEQKLQIINQTQTPGTLSENILLMPEQSWGKYRYLFVRDLDRNEWDKVTDFYDKCQRYDEAVRYNNTFFKANAQSLTANMHEVLAGYAKDFAEEMISAPAAQKPLIEAEYIAKRKQFIDAYTGNTTPEYMHLYNPMKPINDAKDVLDSIEPSLSLTSVGIKLKRLAKTSGGPWTRVRTRFTGSGKHI